MVAEAGGYLLIFHFVSFFRMFDLVVPQNSPGIVIDSPGFGIVIPRGKVHESQG